MSLLFMILTYHSSEYIYTCNDSLLLQNVSGMVITKLNRLIESMQQSS